MKHRLFSVILALSLTACASGPTAFGPAQNYDDIGFRQTQIQNDRFRVSYTAANDIEAQDFALLRAAQITLDKGYSHFEVITGHMSGNLPRSGIGSSVGVGFGNGGYRHGGTSVGVNVGVNDIVRTLEGNRVTNSIEIKLLPTKGTNVNVYEAQSLVDSIRPQVFSGP